MSTKHLQVLVVSAPDIEPIIDYMNDSNLGEVMYWIKEEALTWELIRHTPDDNDRTFKARTFTLSFTSRKEDCIFGGDCWYNLIDGLLFQPEVDFTFMAIDLKTGKVLECDASKSERTKVWADGN